METKGPKDQPMKTNPPKDPSKLDLSNSKISKSVCLILHFSLTCLNIFNLFTFFAFYSNYCRPNFMISSFLKQKSYFYDLSEEGEFKIYIIIYWYDELTYISSDLYLCLSHISIFSYHFTFHSNIYLVMTHCIIFWEHSLKPTCVLCRFHPTQVGQYICLTF